MNIVFLFYRTVSDTKENWMLKKKLKINQEKKHLCKIDNLGKNKEYFIFFDSENVYYRQKSNLNGEIKFFLPDLSFKILNVVDKQTTKILQYKIYPILSKVSKQSAIIINPNASLQKCIKNEYPLPLDIAQKMNKQDIERYFSIIMQEDRFQKQKNTKVIVLGDCFEMVDIFRKSLQVPVYLSFIVVNKCKNEEKKNLSR